MARYILDINANDELHSVIQKCNSNFKAIMSQVELQAKDESRTREQDIEDTTEEIADAVSDATEEWNQNLGDAVDDLVQQIGDEATARSDKDGDLEDAIETVDNKFADYTMTADLAAVATSGDYDDLDNKPVASDFLAYSHDDILWVIENNTVGEVMKKTDVSGYTDLVVRCVGEDGNPCYTPLALIPEDSYQNYTANGKTFKMQINASDNRRLWWVVPAGKWELWMR